MSIGGLLLATAGLFVASVVGAVIAILVAGWFNKLAEKWNTEE